MLKVTMAWRCSLRYRNLISFDIYTFDIERYSSSAVTAAVTWLFQQIQGQMYTMFWNPNHLLSSFYKYLSLFVIISRVQTRSRRENIYNDFSSSRKNKLLKLIAFNYANNLSQLCKSFLQEKLSLCGTIRAGKYRCGTLKLAGLTDYKIKYRRRNGWTSVLGPFMKTTCVYHYAVADCVLWLQNSFVCH